MSMKNKVKLDFVFAFGIILFAYFIISKIPFVNKVMEELGKKSGMIFMFHTFIYDTYFRNFIYSFKYSIIIFIMLTVVCYLVAGALELLMKVSGYRKLINKITV